MDSKKAMVLEFEVDKDKYIFPSSISEALVEASDELNDLDDQLNETLDTIEKLTLNCDKNDYILSASSGVLCGTALNIKKKEFSMEIMDAVEEALSYNYL